MLFGFRIHRLFQDDLDVRPFLCVHRHSPGRSVRVFCVWKWGVEL